MVEEDAKEVSLSTTTSAVTWRWLCLYVRLVRNISITRIKVTDMVGKIKSQKISVDELKQIVIDSEETVWTVTDVAKMLNISEQAVRKRILRGRIPAHKDGGFWYILKSEFISRLRTK